MNGVPIYFHIYHLGGKIHDLFSSFTIPNIFFPIIFAIAVFPLPWKKPNDDRKHGKGGNKLEYNHRNGNRYFESNPPHHQVKW